MITVELSVSDLLGIGKHWCGTWYPFALPPVKVKFRLVCSERVVKSSTALIISNDEIYATSDVDLFGNDELTPGDTFYECSLLDSYGSVQITRKFRFTGGTSKAFNSLVVTTGWEPEG